MKIGFRERRRGIIEKILVAKRAEVARMTASVPLWPSRAPGLGVAQALTRAEGQPLKTVIEIASRQGASQEEAIARALAAGRAGAAAIVVSAGLSLPLGDFATLAACRDALDDALGPRRPRLLAADYFLDPIQLGRAEDAGADGVILIARIVSRDALARLVEASLSRQIEPVIAIARAEEVALATSLGARVVGLSGRDLRTMRVDPDGAASLLPLIEDAVTLLLDGVITPGDHAPHAAVIG